MNAIRDWLGASPADASSPEPTEQERRPNRRKRPIKRADLRVIRSESFWGQKRTAANGDPKMLADVERAAVWSKITHLPEAEQAAAWQRVGRLLRSFSHEL